MISPAAPFQDEYDPKPGKVNHNAPKTVSGGNQGIIPHDKPQTVKSWDETLKEIREAQKATNDLANVVAGLVQGLANDKLRQLTRTDWVRTFSIDTNTADPKKLMAGILTGGRPFAGFTVLSVGGAGATLKVSINGDEPFAVSTSTLIQNEIIWSLEFVTGTPAAGTAKVRVNAYTGP